MKNPIRKVVAVLAVAAVVTATVGCGNAVTPTAATSSESAGILVTTAPPTRGDMELQTSFVGSVQPDQVVSVIPKMPGTVKKVHVTVGQEVKKGDLLVTLDDKDILPAIQQAEAAYNSAKAQTQQMTGSSYKSQLSGLDAQFDQAVNGYENAQDSVRQLIATKEALPGIIAGLEAQIADPATTEEQKEALRVELASSRRTLSTIDSSIAQAEDGEDYARKMMNNARSTYNAVKVEGQEEMQNVADATLATAEAGLNSARQQLEYTKITSPIDGVVESISASELNMVANAAPALIVSNKSSLSVSFNVPSASIAAMEVGGVVNVRKGQNNYTATITEVSTIINQQTGLFTVKAEINDTDVPDLLTGVMVKVTAPTQKSSNTLLLAQDSVYFDEGQAYVYLLVDGFAKKTFVETGISNPQQIEVISGVSDSDVVITSWHPNLIDGAQITAAS